MHYMDRTYGRGLAAHPMPLTSHDYPPGVKSPLEKLIERERADERAKVVDEILADLKSEIDWQDEHYGAGTDKTGMGRLIGMQDAYATVARHRGAPAESVVGALPGRPLDRVLNKATCGHCSGPQRGYASASGKPLCHPDYGMDCYREVTVYHHPMPCGACSAERAHLEGLKAAGALPDQAGTREEDRDAR